MEAKSGELKLIELLYGAELPRLCWETIYEKSNKYVYKKYQVKGIVQGVGFRPFVYRIAKNMI